ncbi:MAG: hypothetical protein JSU76_00220, partial [Dehalococcoidia bacterium]
TVRVFVDGKKIPADDEDGPAKPLDVTAKIRYQSPEAAAELRLDDGVAEVSFCQPQKAIAPGQAVVFYQGDAVLGGGIIEHAK